MKTLLAVLLLACFHTAMADDMTEQLKSINRQIIEHNDRLDAMAARLREMFGNRASSVTNHVVTTNVFLTNKFIQWPVSMTNYIKRDYIKKMESSGDLTNVINQLVTSGKLCAVIGHSWGDHIHTTLEYVPSRTGCRECKVCKLHQERYASDWK